MRFSIISPTIQRPTLLACCESVTAQTHADWEHIVIVDGPPCNAELLNSITHPQRTIVALGARCQDFGNTPRHIGWKLTQGDYALYLDDDNRFAYPEALADIAAALADGPDWAVFPILRFGQVFFSPDPRCCHVDAANMVIRRGIAQWPAGPEYTMDGIFCDALRRQYPFRAFENAKPIIVVPVQGKGE